MTQSDEYIQEINQLKNDTISDFEELLTFAKELLSSAKFKNYIKAKTIIRYNTFSALYQRADAVLAMTRVNQGNAANIVVRSMWETLVEYDFINLQASNINLEIRLASESEQQLAIWTDVQRLRSTYPNAETWQKTISDDAIIRTIARRRAELSKFKQAHPSVNLNSYKSLILRLQEIDASSLSKNPNHRNLTQFDYRTFYSLLSSDTHSTVLGNMHNSRIEPKVSLEIRLDAPIYETVRSAQIAYKLLLKFLQNFNENQGLKKGEDLQPFRLADKKHNKDYERLQNKYQF